MGPAASEEDLSFIEIAMIGEDKEPIPGVRFRVWSTADAQLIEGELDEDGFARVEGIRPGRWRITFPDLDEEAWAFVDEVAPRRAARHA